MREDSDGLRCPSCRRLTIASPWIFSGTFRCLGCGIRLQVSPRYTRGIVLTSYLISFLFVWVAGTRGIVRFCVFWTATAFLIFPVVIRVAPHLLRPILIPRQLSHITTLGLGNNEETPFDDH
jgi:hypothetical protein